MSNKKTLKRSLLTSFVSLFLSFSMLVGTTFAWFTDSVSSGRNVIVAGNLDVELYHADKGTNSLDEKVDENTVLFDDVDSDLWEPGAMAWEKFTVANEGNLALKYEFELSALKASVVQNISFATKLRVAVVDESFVYTRANVMGIAEENWNDLVSFTQAGDLEEGESDVFGIIIWWQPSANDNIFNMNNGQTEVVSVEVGVTLKATQTVSTSEKDSFDENYDSNAVFQKKVLRVNKSKPLSSNATNANGELNEATTVGDTKSTIRATVPAGVAIADGADELTLSVKTIENSQANVTLTEEEEAVSVDVHMEGVSENNNVPMQIILESFLRKGLNFSSVKLYHVEDGVTVEMRSVTIDQLDEHNEYTYDPITGDVILSLASFSPIMTVANTDNVWEGGVATAFAGGTGTEADPYKIANAEQLAYFGAQVDSGVTFKDKFVKLTGDIILNHEDDAQKRNFNPIGYGYDYDGFMTDGKTFNGTFDGDGHAIHGLYQNGWDLEAENPGEDYTYSMAGGGLFASVVNATIKNLTIKHANITMECVDMGILVGYSQGTCNYENIYIYKSSIANYQRATGGVVGEVSPHRDAEGKQITSQHNFKNVHVGSSCTVGSLWGDFDAPCGGVIGTKWDKYDSDETKVYMEGVDVSCVLDVYNDVTSAYQWYAYRRAGMLIGDTEQAKTENGRTVATADFLTCKDCVVIYDDWRNYTYCEFTNEQNPGKNYPWVRVEPGLNCSSYSNPRYGHPLDAAGNPVIDDLHVHQAGDSCTLGIQFNQLYGGGQGVYGQATHAGVTEGKYTITFMDHGEVVDVLYVTTDQAYKIPADKIPTSTKVEHADHTLKGWEDANNVAYATLSNGQYTDIKTINAGNLVDIVLYPTWESVYKRVRFLDHNNKVVYEQSFKPKDNSTHNLDTTAIEAARMYVQRELDDTEKVIQVKWDKNLNNLGLSSATDDIIVKMQLTLSNLSITLEPVYDNTTNQLIRYRVVAVNASDSNKSIHIPSHVGRVPVDEIYEGAFDGFDNLTAVRIPETMTKLGAGMFPGDTKLIFGSGRQTVTLYYEGTYEQWEAIEKESGWDDTLGDGSRVFFLDANGKVDKTKGFIELLKYRENWYEAQKYEWIYHNHEYVKDAPSGCQTAGHYKNFTDYYAEGRPDRNYWI